MFFSLHSARWHIILICSIIDVVHFDHLIKLSLLGFSAVNLLFSLLLQIDTLWEDFFMVLKHFI